MKFDTTHQASFLVGGGRQGSSGSPTASSSEPHTALSNGGLTISFAINHTEQV